MASFLIKMKSSEFLKHLKENDVPLADIRVLYEDLIGMSFSDVPFSGEKEILEDSRTEEILRKLKSGYPVVYLTGFTTIRGLHINLNENVLIPRTETIEFMYDRIKNNFDFHHKKVLDLCTGSGFIALALKQLYPDCEVYASDISEEALATAKKNALQNHMDIHFLHSDFLRDITDTFDVILSNPPYIEEDSKDVDAPFEPSLALFSGKDGMDSYRQIFARLSSHLKEDGMAFFELESTNAEKTASLFRETVKESYDLDLWKDMNGKDRYLEAFRR